MCTKIDIYIDIDIYKCLAKSCNHQQDFLWITFCGIFILPIASDWNPRTCCGFGEERVRGTMTL